MKAIKKALGVSDETIIHSKLYKKPTTFTKIKDNVPLIEGYNYMADILHLPDDKFGFNKLLVVVDIGSDAFDIEKMKGETAKETLSAYYKMLHRGIVKIPYASMLTDGGASFQGVFDNFLFKRGTDHRTALPGRHHQLSSADSLCRALGDIFNAVMNQKESETGKPSKAWTHAIDNVRTELNDYRKKRFEKKYEKDGPIDLTTYKYPFFDSPKKPKYKVGDLVSVIYNEPRSFSLNASGENTKQNTKNFRMGDMTLSKKKYRVSNVLYYSGYPSYRYMLDGYPKNKKQSASFTEEELR